MKKKLSILVLALCLMAVLAACGCDHAWNAANCTEPKKCSVCHLTEATGSSPTPGSPLPPPRRFTEPGLVIMSIPVK